MKAVDKLKIEYRPLKALIPYARNPRTHSESQVQQIAASIREFGWTNPILVDGANGVIAGHGRLLAAEKLRLKQVPCIELSNLTEAQRKAYILADNQLAQNAGWDEALLRLELADLAALDFDLDLIGFDPKELSALLEPEPEEEARPSIPIRADADLLSLAPSEEERAILTGRHFLIEFSGGKDSSAAAVWTKHYFPDAKLTLCYVDLGADFYGFSIFLQQFSEALGVDLVILRSPESIIDVFLKKGKWPAFIGSYCHKLLRGALDAMLKQYQPHEVIVVRGGRAQESATKDGHLQPNRFLVIDRMKQYIYFQPLYYITKECAVKILDDSGMPIWEGYSRGLQRTACRICPGQRPAAYAAMRKNFPEIWAELLELERRLGTGAWQGSKVAGVWCSFGELADRAEASAARKIEQEKKKAPGARRKLRRKRPQARR